MPQVFDVLILGAGASGLLCAMLAAGRGKSVLLVDHGAKPGRKLAVTGGGRCNVTNRSVTPQDYVGENPRFCRSALSRFGPDKVLEMLATAGIASEEREQGQIFCRRSAKDLVAFLAGECSRLGCRMALDERVLGADALRQEAPQDPDGARFRVRTANADHAARALVVALGSPAWPQVGASGTGYEIARGFGHRIVPIRPALVGLVMPDTRPDAWPLLGLSGIATPVSITVALPPQPPQEGKRSGGILAADSLPLLFTHTGVSGPAALQASLYWRKNSLLRIDFLPGRDPAAALDDPASGKLLCRTLFRRHLPDRLCDALLPAALHGKKVAELSRRERETITRALTRHEVVPVATEGFARAEVAAGGVSTDEISSRSMESKRLPGLFFCGEVLDVTGRLGGYNLHWAFASAHAVACSL